MSLAFVILFMTLIVLHQFNHEWGGKPWESKSKALSEKYAFNIILVNMH